MKCLGSKSSWCVAYKSTQHLYFSADRIIEFNWVGKLPNLAVDNSPIAGIICNCVE